MWKSVFGNLQNDLSDFAKELSAGVPRESGPKGDGIGEGEGAGAQPGGTADSPAILGDAIGTSSPGSEVSPDETDAARGTQADAGSAAAQSLGDDSDASGMDEIGSAAVAEFQLQWAMSSDEDDDEDDIASEWEQVTRTTVSSTSRRVGDSRGAAGARKAAAEAATAAAEGGGGLHGSGDRGPRAGVDVGVGACAGATGTRDSQRDSIEPSAGQRHPGDAARCGDQLMATSASALQLEVLELKREVRRLTERLAQRDNDVKSLRVQLAIATAGAPARNHNEDDDAGCGANSCADGGGPGSAPADEQETVAS